MTVKSIVDVDINDEKFRRFVEFFRKYDEAVKKHGMQWSKIDKLTEQSRKSLQSTIRSLGDGKKLSEDIAEHTEKASSLWERLSEHSRRFAGSIKTATGDLIRWTSGKGATALGEAGGLLSAVASGGGGLLRALGIGGLVAGGVGALVVGGATGNLFGLGDRANRVLGERRKALGLGLTIGEQRAFELQFGQVVDASSLLASVAEVRRDPTKAWMLGNLGVSPGEMRGDTAQVSEAVLRHVKGLVDQTPENQLGLLLRTHPGLAGVGLDVEQLSALKATSMKDLAEYSKNYRADQKSLGLDDNTAKAWQQASVKFAETSANLDRTLTKTLLPLATTMADSGQLVSKGAAKFAQAVDDFSGAVGYRVKHPEQLKQDAANVWGSFLAGARGARNITGNLSTLRAIEARHGLPTGLLQNLFGAESGYGRYLVGPDIGGGVHAVGPFQFHPDTARAMGLTSKTVMDVAKAGEAAARLMDHLLKVFHGDFEKAIAAYNIRHGEARIEDLVRRYGPDWASHLPRETKGEIEKVLRGRSLPYGVHVKIENATGGNTIVSTKQAAGGQ